MKLLTILLLLALTGCVNFKTTLPNGTEIIYQKVFTDTRADRAEMYFEDPNTVMWIVLNDPNGSVHPGRLVVTEPKTGIEVGVESE